MKLRTVALLVYAAATAPLALGCEEEPETPAPAFPPQPIGYTPPPSSPRPVAPPVEVAAQEGAPAPSARSAASSAIIIDDGPASNEPGPNEPVGVDVPPGAPVGASEPPGGPPGAGFTQPPYDEPTEAPPGAGSAAGEAPAGPAEPPPGDDGSGYADTDPSALSDFRSTLDPYGSWVEDPTYGTVWTPSPDVVGEDFTPYLSAGHWAYDDDYTWVSDYSWGWAPFHYGRWVYAGPSGWEWIPGRRYAGAWVSWRYGAPGYGYVGWGPMSPTWCWRHGAAVGVGFVPRTPYTFVPTQGLFGAGLAGHVIAGPSVGVVASHTRPWIPARPAVGGSPAAGGPPPAALNLGPSAVARVSLGDRGVTQARAFARPTSAIALGARAPVTAVRARASVPYAAYGEPSHFGGRLGGGFRGGVPGNYPIPSRTLSGREASAPYYAPSRPVGGYAPWHPAGGYAAAPRASAPVGAPVYRSSAGFRAAPGPAPAWGGSRPAPSPGGFRGAAPSTGGGGGGHSFGGGGRAFGGGGGRSFGGGRGGRR